MSCAGGAPCDPRRRPDRCGQLRAAGPAARRTAPPSGWPAPTDPRSTAPTLSRGISIRASSPGPGHRLASGAPPGFRAAATRCISTSGPDPVGTSGAPSMPRWQAAGGGSRSSPPLPPRTSSRDCARRRARRSRPSTARPGERSTGRAERDQGRLERDRRERVDDQTCRLAVRHRRDEGDAGGEPAERVREGARVRCPRSGGSWGRLRHLSAARTLRRARRGRGSRTRGWRRAGA